MKKTIKPSFIKQLVDTKITQITGESSKIHGEMFWQLFPTPRIKLEKLEIGSKDLLPARYAMIESLYLRPQILPLFWGEFRLNEVVIGEMQTKIDLDHPIPAKIEDIKEIKPKVMAENRKFRFSIKQFNLKNSNIELMSGDYHLKLRHLNCQMSHIKAGNQAIPVEIETDIETIHPKFHIASAMGFKGRLALDPQIDVNNLMQDLKLRGQLSLNNIRANQLSINSLNGFLDFSRGKIHLNPLTLSLYQGQSIGDFSYQLTNQLLQISQTATGIDGAELSQALSGYSFLKAKMNYSLQAKLPLNAPMKSWQANGKLDMHDGSIRGFDLNYLIDLLVKKINQAAEVKSIDLNTALAFADMDLSKMYRGETPFQLSELKWQLNNQQIISDHILMQTSRLKVYGKGRIDLTDSKIDALLKASITDMSESDQVFKAQDMLGGSFPIRLSGTVQKPSIFPDMQAIQPIISQYLLKHQVDKHLDKLKDKLKGLFN